MLEQPLSSETNTKKINLMDLTRQQMREFFAELGEKPFRADRSLKLKRQKWRLSNALRMVLLNGRCR